MRERAQNFDPRQHMTAQTFEIFHYKEPRPADVEVHHHDFYEVDFLVSEGSKINAFEIKDINMTLHNINKTENEHINLIKTAITDCDEKSDFISSLISVPILRKEVCDSAFLDKIKAKI